MKAWIQTTPDFEYEVIDDGKPFKSRYTSRDSRVNISFPWAQPDSPEYVFVPTEQFPNEVIA